MSHKKLIAAAVAISAIAGISAAQAADMPAHPWLKTDPVPVANPIYDWTGIYVGLEGGGSWGNSRQTLAATGLNLGDAAYSSSYKSATVKLENGMTKSGSAQVIDITQIGSATPAGTAFIAYTLSPTGLAQYKAGGFTLITPTVVGDKSAVPSAVLSELGS